jgi:hypothetical protein
MNAIWRCTVFYLSVHRLLTLSARLNSISRNTTMMGILASGTGELIKLSFRIERDCGLHLLESPLSTDQQVREVRRHYQISATVTDSAMLD